MTRYTPDRLDHLKKEETWNFATQHLSIFLFSKIEDVLPRDFVHYQSLLKNDIVLRPMYQQVKEIAFISQRSKKLDKCLSRQVDYTTYNIQSATVQNKLKTKK